MSSERCAILLEFVSFFLVTVDLIGKSRLKAFQIRLSSLFDKIKKLIEELKIAEMCRCILTKWLIRLPIGNGIKLIFAILCIGIIVIFLIIKKVPYVDYIVYSSLLFLYVIVALFILLLMLFLLEWLLDKLITLTLFMFEKFHLEGIFLVVGAILFSISKAISFFL